MPFLASDLDKDFFLKGNQKERYLYQGVLVLGE